MPICPNCLSSNIVKFGKYRETQRWRCMNCRRTTLFVRRRMPRGSRNITQETRRCKMLCTFCHTGNTRLIERTCRIVFDATNPKTDIADCHIEERWLCLTCGNPFTPTTSKVEPWYVKRMIRGKRPKRIPKSEIAKEFFRGL